MSTHKNLGREKSKSPHTRKTVRISSKHQEKEISPSAKEFNRANTFTKEDRRNTIQTIRNGLDKDFLEYMEERRKTQRLHPKLYRRHAIQDAKNREKILEDIRNKTRKVKRSITPTQSKSNETRSPPSRPKKRVRPQLVSSSLSPSSKTPTSIIERVKNLLSLNSVSKK